jgi:hypothetical protein
METGEDTQTDGKEWVQCETCCKWVHTDCEVQNGYTNLCELVAQDESLGFQYFCISCRKKQSNSPNNKYDSSTTPTSISKKLDLTKLALQSIDRGDYSDDLEDPHLAKLTTSESLCESQSTSEKRRDSKESQYLGKAKIKAVEKGNQK